jgi:alpha-L-rhamnosidase
MLIPVDIRLDSRLSRPGEQPIPVLTPSISWRLEVVDDRDGAGRALATGQQGYRIVVTSDEPGHRVVRDTGWVDSGRMSGIEWEGQPLTPLAEYWVRVAVRDDAGVEGPWSEVCLFETAAVGLVWEPPFISAPAFLAPSDTSRPVYLRHRFYLEAVPRRPRLLATALGLYEVWVNGQRVGEDVLTPGWTAYSHRVSQQTYDVGTLLRTGENVIGVIIGVGWYAGELTWLGARNLYGERTAISLSVVDADATKSGVMASALSSTEKVDEWEASLGPIVYSELYHGEEYDARLERPDWCVPSDIDGQHRMDARSDSGFLPLESWEPCEPLSDERDFRIRVEPQDGPAVRRQAELSPVRVIRTPKGETVVDFGQNLTGWVRISPTGKAGERVVLSHSEVLDGAGNFYTENMRSARNRISYTLGRSRTDQDVRDRPTWEPHFTFQGFRYIRVEEAPEAMQADLGTHPERYFTAVVIHSQLEATLDFSCSDDRINQLHHNILWSWKGNAVDVPTDCPQRDERLGWTGDAQVFIGTAAYLTDVRLFFRRWLRDLSLEQRDDGGVPFVIPDVLSAVMHMDSNLHETHSSTGWGDAAVICPITLFDRYGDRETLQRQYPSMRSWIGYIQNHAEDGLLWNTGFHFGDWLALDAKEGSYFGATPNDLTATAYYAYSTALTARAAEVLGYTDDAARLRELHSHIVNAFRREFLTPGGRLAAQTQTAHLLALAFDLIPEEHRERTVRDLLMLLRENDNHLVTGFLGTPLLLPVLSDNGHHAVAYGMLLREEYPSWLYQVVQGATTIWEHWDGVRTDGTMWSSLMNSFNHYAYGAVGEWIYRTIGGIDLRRSDIESRRFVIAPRPGGGVSRATIRYRSVYGDVVVSWSIHGGTMQTTVDIPINTTALLDLPEPGGTEVVGPGRTERQTEYRRDQERSVPAPGRDNGTGRGR